MASLNDFSPASGAAITDFSQAAPFVRVTNEPSNLNMAAYAAALSGDPDSIEATYLQASGELEEEGRSALVEDIKNRAQESSASQDRAALVDILSDASLTDEMKQAALQAYNSTDITATSLQDIVAQQALIAPSGDDETRESSDTRDLLGPVLEEVNAYHRVLNARLNTEIAKSNPTVLRSVGDFLEIIMPFAESKMAGSVIAGMQDGDPLAQADSYAQALLFLGEMKEEMSDILARVPIEQRGVVTEKLFDVINNSASIVVPGDNELARIDFLRTAFEEDYYGDTARWVDNAISVADASFLGMGVGRVGKIIQGRRALRGSRGAGSHLDTPMAERTSPSLAPDSELRAAEDAAEASFQDRLLRAAEDEAEASATSRRQAFEADPVRRAEDAAARRAESRRAVMGDDDDLLRLEGEAEKRAATRREGGLAAKLSDEDLIAAENAAEAIARNRYVESEVSPVTLSQVYRNTNPSLARATSRAVDEDATGQVARATYGTSRTEAVAFDHAGNIGRADGSVTNKVSQPDAVSGPGRPSNRVMDAAHENGAIYIPDAEKAAIATRVINDFNDAVGLVTRNEMTVPRIRDPQTGTLEQGAILDIGVTYGPRDSGWSNGQEALERVKASLRAYGVRDDELTLLRREGDNYVPTRASEATEPGDFLVQVNYPYRMTGADVEDWTTDMSVLWNFLDRIPHFLGAPQGTINRHIFDAHSMFHPNISFGANVAVEQASQLEKVLTEMAKRFSDQYNSLSKVSQQAVEREIKRANKEGRNRKRTELIADGFGEPEWQALKSWRETWDTMYWLENTDMVKTLRNRNFQALEDRAGDTLLFVKEVGKRRGAGSFQRAYDPETGQMVNMTADMLDDLYDKGGSIGTLRSGMPIGDEVAETVISRNNPGGPYIRRIRDDDKVLNYREGYYSVHYNRPKFIDQVIRDSRGNVIKTRAVSTAADTSSATRMRDRLQGEAEPNISYEVRDGRERMRLDSDDNWNIQEAQGRVAQRARGQRLEDSTSPITDELHNHILGPVDSLLRSVRSISNRVPMRDYLESMKARAMQVYGKHMPRDAFGRAQFPSSAKGVKGFSSEAADARSTIEYINGLERGFVNIIDDGIKYAMRAIADAAGERGMSLTERAANFAGDFGGPTKIGRGTAFTAYLALNPARQFIVQSHQAIQLLALAPRYAASGRLAGDTGAILAMKLSDGVANPNIVAMSNRSKEYLEEMYKRYEASGLSASIDKSNLVKGSLSEIAAATSAGGFRKNPLAKAMGRTSQGIALSRKAGFDAGEEVNMLTSWLTHYNRAVERAGTTKLTAAGLDMVRAEARSYTYNMTRAGEMPYNENFLGMIFQFMQVPHKALLQMTTNRTLTGREKARLALFNTVWYGGPPGTVLAGYMAPWLPDEGPMRETVLQGLEGAIANKALTMLTGDIVDSDYQSMAAIDNTGLTQFVSDLWTTDVGKILADSPAGSLVAGSNPRITNFAKDVAEYFHFTDPVHMDRAKVSDVALSAAQFSSGLSNAFKARLAFQEGKLRNSRGEIVDHDVSKGEAFMQALGFSTRDVAKHYYVSMETYEQSQAFEDDIRQLYDQFKREMVREGIRPEEAQYAKEANNFAWGVYQDSTAAYEVLRGLIMRDVRKGDNSLQRSVLQRHQFMDPDKTDELINTLPGADPEQREHARRVIENARNYDWRE